MKKYGIFAISFILLFTLLEVLSGTLLTYLYRPDIEEAFSQNLPHEVVISSSNSFLLTLFIAFLAATIAYFISIKMIRQS
ncbi:hypothetical protein ACLIA0_13685 [Bacillaceae bacterium W0354]